MQHFLKNEEVSAVPNAIMVFSNFNFSSDFLCVESVPDTASRTSEDECKWY